MAQSKVEFVVLNNDDCIGIVYNHETFGRILAIRGNINPEFTISLYDVVDGSRSVDLDLFDFIVQAIPKDNSNDPKTETSK